LGTAGALKWRAMFLADKRRGEPKGPKGGNSERKEEGVPVQRVALSGVVELREDSREEGKFGPSEKYAWDTGLIAKGRPSLVP